MSGRYFAWSVMVTVLVWLGIRGLSDEFTQLCVCVVVCLCVWAWTSKPTPQYPGVTLTMSDLLGWKWPSSDVWPCVHVCVFAGSCVCVRWTRWGRRGKELYKETTTQHYKLYKVIKSYCSHKVQNVRPQFSKHLLNCVINYLDFFIVTFIL